MQIRTKFLLFTLGIAVIFSGFRVYDSAINNQKLLLERTVIRTESLASFFTSLAGEYLENNRKARLIEVLGSIKNLPQIVGFSLVDAKGNKLYHMVPPGRKWGKTLLNKDVKKAEDDTYSLKQDIIRNGEYLGYIEMAVTLEGIKASVENMLWRSLFLNLASLGALFTLVWRLTLRLGRGMNNLHQLAENVGSEKLPAAPEWKLEPDLEEIAHTLRQLHADLRAEEKDRKKVEKVKNDFFAMTVHDLKQPITSLKASMDLLLPEQERTNFGEKALRELSYVAQSSLTRLTVMIVDLLNVAKLSSPDFQMKKETLGLDGFLGKCAEENSVSVNAAGKKWKLSVPVEIKGCTIYAAPELISRVIGNLVLNAIQYTPAGGHITLGVRLLDEQRQVELYVSDEGSGIPENFREEIFKKYSTMSADIASAGLGLAFCIMAAERHSATMTVKSEIGKGTEIGFIVPVSCGEPGGGNDS